MVQHDLHLFVHLLAAGGLGFVVGFERQLRRSDAGDRTFALVALGAAAFTILGQDAFPSTAEKLIAGVPTGIGFIGAGVLIRDDAAHMVKGLNTAAALFAVAAAGVMAGGGRILLAALTTLTVLVVLEVPYLPLVRYLDARRYSSMARSEADPPKGM